MSEGTKPLGPLKPPLPGEPTGYGWDDRYADIVKIFPHEPLEDYIKDGFHPVTLGERFCNGRYTVRHKLGFGGHATVWLAKDGHDDHWVALKIKMARASSGDIEQDQEIQTLKLLEHKYNQHPSPEPRCFAQLLNYFQHQGHNGTHTCLVTELLGPSIAQMMRVFDLMIPWDDPEYQEVETFRPDTILRSARQILKAVETLENWGIVHGDLSPSNVSFTCQTSMDNEQELIDTLGGEPIVADYSASEPRAECLPRHLVKAAPWSCWYDCPQESIRLIDWGESFSSKDRPSVLAQPRNLQSPETFFVGSFDHRHDLWRAGCVINQLFYRSSPFGLSLDKQEHIHAMTLVMGPLPPTWQGKWKEIMLEKHDFSSTMSGEQHRQPLSKTFETRRQFVISLAEKDQDDKPEFIEDDYHGLRCLLGVMEGLMQHDPERRITAREALDRISWQDQWVSLEIESEFEEVE